MQWRIEYCKYIGVMSLRFPISWICVVVVPLVDLGCSKPKLVGDLNSHFERPFWIFPEFLFKNGDLISAETQPSLTKSCFFLVRAATFYVPDENIQVFCLPDKITEGFEVHQPLHRTLWDLMWAQLGVLGGSPALWERISGFASHSFLSLADFVIDWFCTPLAQGYRCA